MRRDKTRLNKQILDEASTWFVELSENDGTESVRADFNSWLRTSPEHVRAYLEISALWTDASALGKQRHLLEEALQSPGENVIPLGSIPEQRSHGSVRHMWRMPKALAIAASALVASLVVGFSAWSYLQRAPTYTTGIGELRSIVLPDGSIVEVNSRSSVRVNYSDGERALELLEGQAFFHVALDPSRPFIVRSQGAQARAVGTQFDVYRKNGSVVVTVLEGRVAVTDDLEPRASPGPTAVAQGVPSNPTVLGAGEQVVITDTTMEQPKAVNVASATAWRRRELLFDSTPLGEVVAEFNRYNEVQLVIEDRSLLDVRINAVFMSTDPGRLLEFLRQRFGFKTNDAKGEIHISKE